MNVLGAWQTDSIYLSLKQFIIERTGLIYFNDKDADLYLRLKRRFEALGVKDCKAYFEILKYGPDAAAEFDRMVIELTIGETYFFRHQEQFDALRERVLPEILKRNELSRRLRIWCAGCSIGAEPYSLAILLAEVFGPRLADWDVKITATDINRAFLAKAEAGLYDEWSFRTTTKELRERHFLAVDKSWQIKPELKKYVEFQYHNLLSSPLPLLKENWGSIDLIICRNVMIYFDWATVAGIMPFFENALSAHGWLIIGHAEQAHGAQNLALTQLPGVSLYQKSLDMPVSPLAFGLGAGHVFTPPVFVPPPLPSASPESVISLVAPVDEALAAEISQLKRLADAGEFKAAYALSEKLLSKHRSDARPYFYRALILEPLGRRDEIEKTLTQVIALDPKFVMAHYYLALFYRQNKDMRKARRSFQNVRALIEELKDGVKLAEADDLSVAELKTLVSSYLEAA